MPETAAMPETPASPAPRPPPHDAASIRAIVQRRYGGPEVLELGTCARPAPGPGEVLVEVAAAGLDRGTWHLMTGLPYLMRLGFGLRRPKQPVAGLDLSGTVVALGPGATGFAVGEAVFGIGRGSFAELACARQDKLARKPERLSFEEAAVLGVSGLTALQALRDGAAVKAGERVLITGASGGVGSYAVQLAKHWGAQVTAVCSAGKAGLVRSLGAERVLDYAAEEWLSVAGPHDVILDLAGNVPLRRLRAALAPEGRLVFVGGEHSSAWTYDLGRQLWAKLCAPFTRQRFVTLFYSNERAADLEVLAELVAEGAITPALDRVFPLAEASAAIRELVAGRARGKLAIGIR